MPDIDNMAQKSMQKILDGYASFKEKYLKENGALMESLQQGQAPQAMVVACCDSRVDPALLLQCDPGDLFVIRNVANIVPPYESDDKHHGTSAALEFGICVLKVKHLILLGHSQCGGVNLLLNSYKQGIPYPSSHSFLYNWVDLIAGGVKSDAEKSCMHADDYAKEALHQSYAHCMEFPWIAQSVKEGLLIIHRWYFCIKTATIFAYDAKKDAYLPLEGTTDL